MSYLNREREIAKKSWFKKPMDCNAAIIPKEEILDAIYHCYQDKWHPLSIGEGGDDGQKDCALCCTLKRHGKNTGIYECAECPIKIDSGRCSADGLYGNFRRALDEQGIRSVKARHFADRFAYYLLDLYARVNQDKVNLPYLAVQKWADKHGPIDFGSFTVNKPKEKEWKAVDVNRVHSKIGISCKSNCSFIIHINVGEIPVARVEKNQVYVYNDQKYKIELVAGCTATWKVYEYI